MRLATPEQLSTFRRRRRDALLIEIASLVLAPVVAVPVLVVMGEQSVAARVTSALVFVAVFVLGQAVRRMAFRCPACTAPLPRGPGRAAD